MICAPRHPPSRGSAPRPRSLTIQYPEEHERCAELLDAWYATSAHRADALQRLNRVDSLQAHDPVGITNSPIEASNLLVARLWQEQGNWSRAEAAARRRYKGLNPRFLSSHLREEGRAAASAGHRGRPSEPTSTTSRCDTTPSRPSSRRWSRCARTWPICSASVASRAHSRPRIMEGEGLLEFSHERARPRRNGMAIGGRMASPPRAVTTAALFGTVTGSDSTGLEDAVVTVTNTATGERWQTATRARGRYVFEYLSVGGPYVVEARAIGFAPAQGTGDPALAGRAAPVRLPLLPADRQAAGDRGLGRDRPAGEPGAYRPGADHRRHSDLAHAGPEPGLLPAGLPLPAGRAHPIGRCLHRRAVGPAQRLPDRRSHQPRPHRIRRWRRLRHPGGEQRRAHSLGRGAAGAAGPHRAVRRALWHLRRRVGERGDPLGLESLGRGRSPATSRTRR